MGLMAVIPEYMRQLSAVAVLAVGGWLVMDGALTIGLLVGFQMLASAFNAPVQALLGAGLKLQAARGVLDQFDDVLDHERSRPNSPARARQRAWTAGCAVASASPPSPSAIVGSTAALSVGWI